MLFKTTFKRLASNHLHTLAEVSIPGVYKEVFRQFLFDDSSRTIDVAMKALKNNIAKAKIHLTPGSMSTQEARLSLLSALDMSQEVERSKNLTLTNDQRSIISSVYSSYAGFLYKTEASRYLPEIKENIQHALSLNENNEDARNLDIEISYAFRERKAPGSK